MATERRTSERTTIPLRGGACGSGSAALAERVLAAEPGVRRAYANAATEMAYVEYDPAETGPDRLEGALARAGLAERGGREPAPLPLAARTAEPVPLSAALLALAGLAVAGVGLYFVLLRPPMLPEDVRYTGASLGALEAAGPGLGHWLRRVFAVLGGYAVATGVLTVYLAWAGLRRRAPYAGAASALAGLASVGLMAAVNVAIGSDYRWPLLALALLWAAAVGLFWARR